MIGQEQLLSKFNNLDLPRFIVITGQRGQGKKTLAKEIANIYNYKIVNVGIKIDDIRYMIDTCYQQVEPIIYLIADADSMSLNAKNSILKVVEEPPQNAYFVMTLKQIENTLQTIKSRCYEIKMNDYSIEEKNEMLKKINPQATEDELMILNKFDNYWQIETINKYGAVKFYEFVYKVYENICKVQSANSFKFSQELDLKNDGNGYDIELFFDMYIYCCMGDIWDIVLNEDWNNFMSKILERWVNITSDYKQQLSINGVSKQMLIDGWLLDIRKAWLENEVK